MQPDIIGITQGWGPCSCTDCGSIKPVPLIMEYGPCHCGFLFSFLFVNFNPPSYLPERLQWAVGTMCMKNFFSHVKNNDEKPISIDRGT
jgi:hypothetical protein